MGAILPGMSYGSGSREPDSASRSSRTVTRLNNLLTRITGKRKVLEKQTKVDKRRACHLEHRHRIQVRWLHYNRASISSKAFVLVKQKNGGGKRFVVYSDEQPLTIEDLKEKGALLFFKNGKSNFHTLLAICVT